MDSSICEAIPMPMLMTMMMTMMVIVEMVTPTHARAFSGERRDKNMAW